MNVTIRGQTRHYRTVSFDAPENAVVLIEQRLLPHTFKRVKTRNYRETAEAIRSMIVRGAGAIGATAAFGLAQGARSFRGRNLQRFETHIATVYTTLKESRPTAIDPVNAMNALLQEMAKGQSVSEKQDIAFAAATRFADENVEHCRHLGDQGVSLIRDGLQILTHCNAGWLAFVDIGTVTAPLYAAQSAGRAFHVYCDETRPRCQGASLTAWELAQQGISHQVIADNAAGFLMSRGEIDMVIVGSDRVLGRTGEVANKIGTYTKAVLAHRHNIPFYVAIPLSTLDWDLGSGLEIPIEDRSEDEVLGAWGVLPSVKGKIGKRTYVRIANPSSTARNPGFDVTPPELITGIMTPLGIFKPRDLKKLRGKIG